MSRLGETVPAVGALGYETGIVRHHPRVSWVAAGRPEHRIIAERTTVGAAAEVDLVVTDAVVSRIHLELVPKDSGLWVRDLGSRNGTFVQGMRVESACVPDGGRVRLGSTELTVTYAPSPAPIEVWLESRFGSLVGRSTIMRELFARLMRVAATDAAVLVRGETGTGKELVARALHDASPRDKGPFVIVDCGALSETLLEAELFGHAKGAFTGAHEARPGAIESAAGGTVFLDEVGELPLPMQPKLLRALESRQVRRLGETHHRSIDVRFISATHRDLRRMVNERAFREDLYFRLSVLPVLVPPLRERRDDIPLLVDHFLGGEAAKAMPETVLAELLSRPWLGNVRELRNFVERFVALGAQDALAATGSQDVGYTQADASRISASLLGLPFKEARERLLAQLEHDYVAALLERHDHNVSAAADAAGLNRTYLHRIIRRLGL